MRIRLVFILALLVLAAVPASASASIAARGGSEGETLVYAADPGERNQVTVSSDGTTVTFEDPGATVAAGSGCAAAGPHRATCTVDVPYTISVQLEDGDDTASTAGVMPKNAFFVGFDGAAGADTLDAGDWPVNIDGGVGADVLRGGPGSPSVTGLDMYLNDNSSRTPRQAPAPDTIECVPAPAGTVGTIASLDPQDTVSGPCGSTANYATGQVIVRGTTANDSLYPGRGPSFIYALEGDDNVYTGSGHRAYGGPGNDSMYGGGLMLGGTGDDRLDAGENTGGPSSLGGESGNDFITGSNSADKVDGGSGTDRISTRGGSDAIKARDGERDSIRCGTGSDIVSADERDSVARDCERVVFRALPRSKPRATRGSASASSPRCAISKARGSKIYARTSTAVLYGRGLYTYACLYAQGKPRKLPDEGGGIKVGRNSDVGVKLAGQYVAYATYGSAIGDEVDRIYVYDIQAGRTLFLEGTTNYISAIVLKPNGSAAWVQGASVLDADPDTRLTEVRKVSLTEREGNVLLDRGTDIDASSLGLSPDGASVTWTRGGEARSSTLG